LIITEKNGMEKSKRRKPRTRRTGNIPRKIGRLRTVSDRNGKESWAKRPLGKGAKRRGKRGGGFDGSGGNQR